VFDEEGGYCLDCCQLVYSVNSAFMKKVRLSFSYWLCQLCLGAALFYQYP